MPSGGSVEQVDQEKLLAQLLDLRDHKATSMAPAVRLQSTHVYVDREHARREIEVLFRQRPLIAGLSAELPHVGDFLTVRLAGRDVVVVRSEDGGVKAFLNACRHRGARLVDGCGHVGRVLRCPYHGWVYDLDGQLLGQPVAQDGFAELDNPTIGLIELPAAEMLGLLIVGPSPEVATGGPADLFGDLAGELGSHGFDSWTPVGQRQGRWPMNWKMPFETFLEAYHIFSLHRETLAREVLATPMLSEFFGAHGRGVLTGRQAPRLAELPRDQWTFAGHANLVYWLFPNTVLSLPMTGHAELWQFDPGAEPGQCVVTTRFYAPEEPTTEKAHAFWERMIDFTMGVVESEDFAQQEAIQRNAASGLFPQRIFGRNEPALIHFHEALDAALDVTTSMAGLAR